MAIDLEKIFAQSGVTISKKQVAQFLQYESLMLEWNKKINLTAITQQEEIYVKHFLDSVMAMRWHELSKNDRMIDVGTGAGFPGVPMAIMMEEIEMTLLDSLNKRVHFLDEVVKALGLENVKTQHGRAEDYGSNREWRECFDSAISRAVAPINVLSEYCLPFVRIGGVFLAMKSSQIDEELMVGEKAIKVLGGEIEKVEKYQLSGYDLSRSLVTIRKVGPTPKQYPRKAGKPSKKPL